MLIVGYSILNFQRKIIIMYLFVKLRYIDWLCLTTGDIRRYIDFCIYWNLMYLSVFYILLTIILYISLYIHAHFIKMNIRVRKSTYGPQYKYKFWIYPANWKTLGSIPNICRYFVQEIYLVRDIIYQINFFWGYFLEIFWSVTVSSNYISNHIYKMLNKYFQILNWKKKYFISL